MKLDADKTPSGGESPVPTTPALGKGLALGVVVINLFVVFLVGLLLSHSRQLYEQRAAIQAQNLAHTLVGAVAGDIDKIDAALQAVADEYEKTARKDGGAGARLNTFIARQQARLPILDQLAIADAEGVVISGGTEAAARPNFGDQECFFCPSADPGPKLCIGKPIQLQAGKQWVLPLSRRLSRADGSFGGVVYALVAVTRFAGIFSPLDIGPHGGISLRDLNMGIIARHPAPVDLGSIIGNRTLSPELRQHLQAGESSATFFTPKSWDNTAKVVSYHQVANYPLFINVGLAREDYLDGWRGETRQMVALVGVFFLLTLLAAWLIARSAAELRKTAQALDLARRGLEQQVAERTGELQSVNEHLHAELGERQKVTAALTANEYRMKEAQRLSKLGSWELDLVTNTLTWSDEIFAILELDPRVFAATYEAFLAAIHPDDRETVSKAYADSLENKSPYALDHRLLMKDGRIKFVHEQGTTLYDAQGAPLRTLGTVQDITEQKQTEAALDASREELRIRERELNESQRLAHVGSWDWDAVHDTIWWSDEYYRIYGFVAGEPPPNYEEHKKAYTPESAARLDAAVKRAMETGEPYEIDLELARPTADTKWITARGEAKRDAGGKIWGLRGTAQNITARKEAEDERKRLNAELEQRVQQRTADGDRKGVELRESQSALMNIVEDLNSKTAELESANTRLQELDQLKSMFIASMSHELRTPLNSIIGFSSIMLNGWTGPLTAEQNENLAAVLRSGKHLLSLINDVIDVSKIEAGKIESIGEEFDVHDLVLEAVETLKKDIEKKGLELKVAVPSRLLYADRRRLLQCLLNLLSNAVKYTLHGAIEISAQPSGDGALLALSVADTGMGIREDELGKLFLPFVRLTPPEGAIIPGTGLGLYLTKKLAQEILGGDILVSSTYGTGSRFTLRVPVNR